jgi:hypothetical protein
MRRKWLGGPGWPRAELVKWAGPKQFLFPLINVFSNLHEKLPAQKYKTWSSFYSKSSKLHMQIGKFEWHNFPFWPNSQISIDFDLQISEITSNLNHTWILKGFKPSGKNLMISIKFNLHMIFMKDRRRWPEGGGEWEAIKIPRRNLAYIPESTRCPSFNSTKTAKL